mgnify:CR=1 FL=1
MAGVNQPENYNIRINHPLAKSLKELNLFTGQLNLKQRSVSQLNMELEQILSLNTRRDDFYSSDQDHNLLRI